MPDRHLITGAILCGGRGRRTGGADKPLLFWHGRTLVANVAERLRPQVARLLISANRNADAYRTIAPVVADATADYQGPLAGVMACLETATTPWLFVCPGDAPELAPDLVARLGNGLDEQQAGQSTAEAGRPTIAVAHDGARAQNLHLLIQCAPAREHLRAYLARGGRSVHGWLANHATVVPCADRAASFANFNEGPPAKTPRHGDPSPHTEQS